MTATVASSTPGSTTSGGGVSPAKPSGLTAGDLLLFCGTLSYASAGDTFTMPTGFAQTYPPVSGISKWLFSAWKIADANDVAATSFHFASSAAGTYAAGVLLRIANAGSSPIDKAVTGPPVSGTQTVTFPTITPVASNGLLIEQYASPFRTAPWAAYPSDATVDQDAFARSASASARATVFHNNTSPPAGQPFTPATGLSDSSSAQYLTASIVIAPAAAPPRTTKVLVGGVLLDKPVKVLVGGQLV